MNTDPTESLAPKASPSTEKSNRTPSLPSELADVSLRQLLGMLLSSTGLAERHAYLQRTPQDKPNGFYDRSLQLGAIPVDLQVPRTRSGAFRPATLPPLYQRGYSQESQSLLLSLLASARSLNAVKDALHKMGLSSSPQELEPVATELIEELDLRNSRPLEPDFLTLFLDRKYVEFRDGDRLRSACIYVVVGLRRDGKKQVLTCWPRPGRENLEDWKLVLRNLLERGLRRLLLLVQDDLFRTAPHPPKPLAQHRHSALCPAYAAQPQNPSQQTRFRRVSTALARHQSILESRGRSSAVRTALPTLC